MDDDELHIDTHTQKQVNTNGIAGAEDMLFVDVTQYSPEFLQRKLYFLVNQLKEMHFKLPV